MAKQTSKRTRVDSKESNVATMIHANKAIEAPDMDRWTKHEDEIFHEVIDEFAKIDWTKHSIRLAALLARTIANLEELQSDLKDEGWTVTTPKGGTGMNPKASCGNMLTSQIMSLRRTLALHATAGVNKGDVGKRRGIRKSQEKDAPEDDGLLAKPDVA